VLEGGESAAVPEGLAHACWWLQEDATTVDCRRRAFRLYLDADDKVSAARVAIFCLVGAPEADAADAVHRSAHGLVADEIFEVREGV
jgi:hypothetical protein